MKAMILGEIETIQKKIDGARKETEDDPSTSEVKVVKTEEGVPITPNDNQLTINSDKTKDLNDDLWSELRDEIIVFFQQWRDKPIFERKTPRALKLNGKIWEKVKIINEVVKDLINKSELKVFEFTFN